VDGQVTVRDDAPIVFLPELLAGGGVDAIKTDAVQRPHSAGEADRSIPQHGPPRHRPTRSNSLVVDALAGARRAVEPPQQLAVGGTEAVESPVISTEVDLSSPDDRRKPHGTLGVETPPRGRRFRVERHHGVVVLATDEHGLARNGNVVRPVDARAAIGSEHRIALGPVQGPSQLQRVLQLPVADSASHRVVPLRGPVGSVQRR